MAYWARMDPARKRLVRLVVSLTAALVLGGALVYTSVNASVEQRTPSQLLAMAQPGVSYKLTGKVVDGSIRRRGDAVLFSVRDRDGTRAVPVSYAAAVPDTFRGGREISLNVTRRGEGFVGQSGTLVTKCPSKFSAKS